MANSLEVCKVLIISALAVSLINCSAKKQESANEKTWLPVAGRCDSH